MGDGQFVNFASVSRQFAYEKAIGNEDAFRGKVSAVFVSSFLAHCKEQVGFGYFGEVDSVFRNHNFGFRGATACFRTIGLGLDGKLAIEKSCFS